MSAGCQRHMTDDGFRVRMAMVGIVVVDTLLEQVAQPAFTEPVEVARRQVTPELVDGDLENEPGFLRCMGFDPNGILGVGRRQGKEYNACYQYGW